MVSGHLIKKPTIALQRLNLQDFRSASPVEQMQSPLPESDEADQIEEVDLTRIAGNTTVLSPASSDEEVIVVFIWVPVKKKCLPVHLPVQGAVTRRNVLVPLEIPG